MLLKQKFTRKITNDLKNHNKNVFKNSLQKYVNFSKEYLNQLKLSYFLLKASLAYNLGCVARM